MNYILLFISQLSFAMNPPTPFPVFLKAGFSSILEFEEAPSQVVLGDPSVFQIEKLNRSVVIKPLATYATTNMFVYFKTKETRLFILTASEDAEPTYFKKFTSLIPPASAEKKISPTLRFSRGARITHSSFDKKKDYLTVDLELSADSNSILLPNWNEIRMHFKDRFIKPSKVWSERQEVQRDSRLKARLIFTKPNVPLNNKETQIVIPLKDSGKSLTLKFNGSQS